MKLYDYFRSTTSYRVRIAIELKQLSMERISVHLIDHGGEHHHPDYLAINPQGLVPSLTLDDGRHLSQSMAILEYLDEQYPNPALLPHSAEDKAMVRSLSQLIGCDMHPLNNLRVLNQLKSEFSADADQIRAWYHHWLKLGFDAFEAKLALLNPEQSEESIQFCYQNQLSMADLCLIPQMYNAQRFEFSLAAYPLIQAIHAHCMTIPAFIAAAPESV